MKKLESLKQFETSTKEMNFIVGGQDGTASQGTYEKPNGKTYSSDCSDDDGTTYMDDVKNPCEDVENF